MIIRVQTIFFFVNELTELNKLLTKLKAEYPDKKVFVIGGASIYNKLINLCDTCLITRLNKEFEADTFFPDLNSHGFTITKESDEYSYEDVKYKFLTYQKIG